DNNANVGMLMPQVKPLLKFSKWPPLLQARQALVLDLGCLVRRDKFLLSPTCWTAGTATLKMWQRSHLKNVVTSSLQEFKDQALKEFAAKAMAALNETLPCALVKATGPLLNQYDEKFNPHICLLRQDLDKQTQRVNAVESKFAAMEDRLAHLGRELDLAKVKPRNIPIPSADWGREVDPTIMHVRAREPVPRKNVEGPIKQWLQPANFSIGEEVQLQGEGFAKQFTLVLQGPHPATRESRRKQAQAALRLPSGQWRSLHIQLATTNIPLYILADKSRKDFAAEKARKKLRRAISGEFGVTTFIDRDGGQLLAKWEPLAK
ncbi:unnamed protein product, partial [Prorocentrum cordatum]